MNWIAWFWSSSSVWEGVEYGAETIVVVCALVEVLADFEHILKGHENEKRRKSVEKRAAIGLVFGLAIGLVALVRTNSLFTDEIASAHHEARDASDRATDASGKAKAASDKAIVAEDRADKAETQAGIAIGQAAIPNKQAEDERMARVRIQASVAWRRLSEQQKVDMGSALGRHFSNQGVSFWYGAGDTESSWFAADIAEALKAAHTLRIYPPASLMTMVETGRLGARIRRV
jgi:hypothetical protein